eukprot:683822-Amphidinium_carterae.1
MRELKAMTLDIQWPNLNQHVLKVVHVIGSEDQSSKHPGKTIGCYASLAHCFNSSSLCCWCEAS